MQGFSLIHADAHDCGRGRDQKTKVNSDRSESEAGSDSSMEGEDLVGKIFVDEGVTCDLHCHQGGLRF